MHDLRPPSSLEQPRSPPSHNSPNLILSEKFQHRSTSSRSDSNFLEPFPSNNGDERRFKGLSEQSRNSNFSSTYSCSPKPIPQDAKVYFFQGEEDDDWLHDTQGMKKSERGNVFSGGFPLRALLNIGTLFLILIGMLMLFLGYPLLQAFHLVEYTSAGSSNLGGTNSSGQLPDLSELGLPSMIDPETPQDVRTRVGYDGKNYQLVFSDEFNTDGRTFWPGDDPFWEAVDLWVSA